MQEQLFQSATAALKRRTFLQRSGVGIGAAALQALQIRDANAADTNAPGKISQGLAGLPHHVPKAKRVIFLCMAGGPSHLETFDYKPKLDQLNGQPMPESFTAGQPIAQLQGQALKVQGHLTKFKKLSLIHI